MIINEAHKFTFANKHCDLYNVIFADIDSINEETSGETSEILLSTTPLKDTWDIHGVIKSEPLNFKQTIIKADYGYFDANEVRDIKKWLCRTSFDWLRIEQDDLMNVNYYCVINDIKTINAGRRTVGLELNITCNSPYAWSELKKINSVVAGTEDVLVKINSDFDKYTIYPILTVTSIGDGSISIKNNNTNKTVIFENCTNEEIITMDCRNYKIKSSKNRLMLDSWNKNVLGLLEGDNYLTFDGNFEVKIEYRLPLRVGG